MKRRLQAWLTTAITIALSGCAMCQSPYDYCGPVMGPGGPNCDWGARRGSIFAPMDDSYVETPLGPTPAEPVPAEAPRTSSIKSGSMPAERTVSFDAVDTLRR